MTETLSPEVTPEIPEGAQWFTFLRCHDELSLELVYVSEEDRKYIHDAYCKQPEWDFRKGQGISARLSELMDRDPKKIALIYSIMLTLPGTPVIYYGDEFGKLNDENYYEEMIQVTGKDDTRFLVRGKIDWKELDARLEKKDSFETSVFSSLSRLLKTRKQHKAFGRGDIKWLNATGQDGNKLESVLLFERNFIDEKILLIHNLSDSPREVAWSFGHGAQITDLNGRELNITGEVLNLGSYEFLWIKI